MGPVVRSPFQTTVFDASAIWTWCWVAWSWFSKLIWNGLLAGASRLSLSNLMPDATRLSAAAGLPAAEPAGMGLAALAAGLAPALGDADDAAEGDGEGEGDGGGAYVQLGVAELAHAPRARAALATRAAIRRERADLIDGQTSEGSDRPASREGMGASAGAAAESDDGDCAVCRGCPRHCSGSAANAPDRLRPRKPAEGFRKARSGSAGSRPRPPRHGPKRRAWRGCSPRGRQPSSG